MKTWANYNGILYSATMWSEDEVKIRTHDKNEATGFEEKKYPDGHSVYIKIVDKSKLEELYDEYEYGTWQGMEFVIDGGTETTHTIWFSQSSVNGSSPIVESMKRNGWQGDPIDVVQMADGRLTTIDNTRVVAARQARIDVQANIHAYDELLPIEYIARFTTKKGVPKTWGDAVELRIGKQKSSFRTDNLFGSIDMMAIH